MAKKIKSSRQTRDHHKQRNNWAVIDIRQAEKKIAEMKSDPKFTDLAGHEGKLLYAIRSEVVLAKTEGAYTEYSARLVASNGGRWSKYTEARRLGLPISRKYMDERDFAVVETAVFDRWFKQARLDWDAPAARSALYAEQGEKILPRLCTTFIPPGEAEEEYQASLPGVARCEPDTQTGYKSGKFGRPRGFKPPHRVRYKIVDMYDFRRRRDELAFDSVNCGLEALTNLPSEGKLFEKATVSTIESRNWRAALEKFRSRAFGEMDLCLQPGRFTALPESVWDKLIDLPNLPLAPTRDRLVEAVRLTQKVEREKHKTEERSSRFAWLPSWEPGMDDVSQLPLPGTLLLRDLLEFPPRGHGSHLKPLIAGKLPRVVLPKKRGRRLRQLPLSQVAHSTFDSSGQAILFACHGPFLRWPPANAEEVSGLGRPSENQLDLRFPRPSSEWSQPPLFPGMDVRQPKRRFVPRRKRTPFGQAKLPFPV